MSTSPNSSEFIVRANGNDRESIRKAFQELNFRNNKYMHNRLHDIDSTSDHNGVSGAVENNVMVFNSDGLPKDSGDSVQDIVDRAAARNGSQWPYFLSLLGIGSV